MESVAQMITIMLVALVVPAFHRALKNLFDGGVPISLLVLDEAHLFLVRL